MVHLEGNVVGMLVTGVLLVIGLVLIIKGGDMFVDAASWVAEKTGIPKLIIGATVVSLATTLPEMLVSFIAAGGGKVDMAIGNATGSVTANVGLILGIALICLPTAVKRRDYLLKSLLMVGAALMLTIFGAGGEIGLVAGILLLLVFVVAMWDNVHQALVAMRRQNGQAQEPHRGPEAMSYITKLSQEGSPSGEAAVKTERVAVRTPSRELLVNISKFVLGAVAIVAGSQLLVDSGSSLAALLGVPERIIGVTIIAIGTSLPELVTTISAIMKKQGALSVGNIIGANIIDLTLILPISALISGKPLPVSTQIAAIDLPACLLVCAIAILPMLIAKRFMRWQGIVLISTYVAYLVLTTLVL